MSKNKQNSIWLALQFLSTTIFSFVNLKLNFLTFGTELYGVWILISSIWGVSAILDLGFGTSMIKFIAESLSLQKKKFKELISTGIIVFFVFGIIIVSIVFLFAKNLIIENPELVTPSYYQKINKVFILLSIAFYIRYITIFFRSILEGMNEFKLISILNMLYNFSIFSSVLLVYLFNFSIVILAIFFLLSSLTSLIIYVAIFLKKIEKSELSIKNFDISVLKTILNFSISVQFISIFGVLIDPILKYLIGLNFSTSTISYYEIARRFSIAVSGLFSTSFRNFLTIASSTVNEKKRYDYFKNEATKLTRLGISFSGFFFGFCLIFISSLIYYFYGIEEAYFIFLVLALSESINNFGYSNYLFLMGTGKTKTLLIVQFLNLTITVTTAVLWFNYFNNILGIGGYFLSVMIGNYIILYSIKQEIKFDFIKYLNDIQFYKLLIVVSMLLVCIYLYFVVGFNLLILSAISMISVFAFYNDIKGISLQFYKTIVTKI